MAKQNEKFKTEHNVFDAFTNKTIFRLISQNHIDGLISPLSIGKEANIFTAKKKDSIRVVKVYRLETCDFNRMYDYIKQDVRYIGLQGKKRKVIFHWVQREFRNLLIAWEAGVRVPRPIVFLNNIIVMDMVGDTHASPKLTKKHPKYPKKFLKDILLNLQLLYKAGLVHADLSPFNILNDNEKPVFIDFSQSTTVRNSESINYLRRDMENMRSFFSKLGLKLSIDDLIDQVVNKNI